MEGKVNISRKKYPYLAGAAGCFWMEAGVGAWNVAVAPDKVAEVEEVAGVEDVNENCGRTLKFHVS